MLRLSSKEKSFWLGGWWVGPSFLKATLITTQEQRSLNRLMKGGMSTLNRADYNQKHLESLNFKKNLLHCTNKLLCMHKKHHACSLTKVCSRPILALQRLNSAARSNLKKIELNKLSFSSLKNDLLSVYYKQQTVFSQTSY